MLSLKSYQPFTMTQPFEKSSLPRTPSRKNFDWWGGRAKGVRSSGKLKRGERFLERPLAISRENRQQGFDKVKSL